MKQKYIVHDNHSRLILLFLGWGMDATPFSSLRKTGYDIMVVYDYTGYRDGGDRDIPLADIVRNYSETVLFGWSFGVRVASSFLKKYKNSLPITRAVAVNGTPSHIHDTLGIPRAIFSGTLAGLSETTLRKFHRRMFADSESYLRFTGHAPQRTFDSLVEELRTFGELPNIETTEMWDIAVISEQDRIFPAPNQHAVWGDMAVTLPDAPHFPDMQAMLDRYVVDKQLVADKFSNATATYGSNASVQTSVAQELWEHTSPFIGTLLNSPLKVLEIGVGNGTLTRIYADNLPPYRLTLWDIADMPLPSCVPPETEIIRCDAETAISSVTAGSVDLLLSASTMQWFHSVPRFIRILPGILAPGGIAAMAMYGSGTYREIEAVTGRSLSYPSHDMLTDTARECGLKILYSGEENRQIFFTSVNELLRHLKLTGVNALGRNKGAQSSAIKLMRSYPLLPDGTAPLTYRPLYLILQKAHG